MRFDYDLARRGKWTKTTVLNSPSASPSSDSLDSADTAPLAPTVHGIRGWRRIALWPLGGLLRLWGATLRFEVPEPDEKLLRDLSRSVAFVLWHNRLFLVSEIFRRYRGGRPVYGLVSASRDGAWLAAFFSLVGIRSVRGSSSRLGREAVMGLIDVLRADQDVGITPDGPRGPRYDFKPGAVVVARRARADILLVGGIFESAWTLRSWDGFYLPKPFSRVRVTCVRVTPDELVDRDRSVADMKVRLLAMNPDTKAARSLVT